MCTDIGPQAEAGPIRCLVPHCRGHSLKYRDSAEYLCARHYRTVPSHLRREHRASCKLLAKIPYGVLGYAIHRKACWKAWVAVRDYVLEHLDPLG